MDRLTGKGYRRQRSDWESIQDDAENIQDTAPTNATVTSPPSIQTPIEPESTTKDYSTVRNLSRQKYLKDREAKKLLELEQELEEYKLKLNLTKKQYEDFEYKSKLYNIIKTAEVNDTGYELPQDYVTQTGKIDRKRKVDVLNAQLYDKSDNKKNRYENQWELQQTKKAQALNTNVSDDIVVKDLEKYEYVFDEEQFVKFDAEEKTGDDQQTTELPLIKPARDITEVRKSLPAYKYREDFLKIVDENQIIVVVGETGSGKTTQLPQYLYEAGYCEKDGKKLMVGCTQPRRVAATSVAARVAEEVQVNLGQEVGYSVRFDDKSSDKTVIKYLTDGILLREFLGDPLLSDYSALIIDEAHERTISTEILLSLLKDISRERSDLKIIVASATINAQKFSDFFDNAPVFTIPGRRFPVTVHYTQQPEANYIQAAINTIFLIHSKKPLPGDILVFLTGQEEIDTMQESLNEAVEKLSSLMGELMICPIYANLPYDQQKKIFEPTPPNTRKVVLATNIAETSITIDGIKYVVDCGYVKENVYNPSTGMDSLVVVPSSKASADQRAGRAGRVGPGECFRLYTKWSFNNELQSNPTPEILRGNLISTVLLLLSLGITDLINFDFMDPPSSETLIKCLELLYAIGALNSKGELTQTGRKMADFPIHPMFSKALLTSATFGVYEDVIAIIAMLGESSNLFYRPKDKKEDADNKRQTFNDVSGDHLTYLNVWNQWSDTEFSSLWCQDNFLQYRSLKRVKDVIEQLKLLCNRTGITLENDNAKTDLDPDSKNILIQKSLVAGFFPHVVKLSRMGDGYRTLSKNQPVYIHPSSSLFPIKPPPKLMLYHELVLTSREYMRNCMVINGEWLQEFAKHYYKPKDFEEFAAKNRFK